MSSNYISLKELVNSANTGADAIKRAPIVEEDTGLRCIRIGDISNNRPFNEWGFTRAEDKVINKFLLKKDDILVARTENTIGVVKYIDKDLKSLYNNGLIRLKVTQNICPKYVYYNLISKNFKQYIYGISAGTSTQPNIKINHMLDYKVMDIPYNEQKAIVDILSSLDDKIELNNQMNKTLEEMAQALFKRWFVDFEFPNEEGQPYKSSGGEMVESELGMIPKGWNVGLLSDYADVEKGLSYKGKHLVEAGVPMINLGNVSPGGGYRKDKIKFYDGDFKDRHIVQPGDIIIANTDMTQDRVILGSPVIVPDLGGQEIIFTHHLFAFKRMNIAKEYLYYYLKSDMFRERAESYATGTTVLAISKKAVLDINFIIPSKEILMTFVDMVKSYIQLIDVNNSQIDKLESIRNSLLPKLMSGEIRVSDLKS